MWRIVGADQNDGLRTLDVDADGNVLVAGTRDLDAYVAKLAAADGAEVWSNVLTGSWTESANAAFTPEGDVVVVGSFAGAIAIGGAELSGPGKNDVFVVKLAGTDGEVLWSVPLGAPDRSELADGVAIAPSGEIFLCAASSEQRRIDQPTPLQVTKLSAEGRELWTRVVKSGDGTPTSYGGIWGCAVAVSADGDPVVAGVVYGTLDFESGQPPIAAPTGHGKGMLFVVQLNGVDGTSRWFRQFGEYATTFALALAVDARGDVLFGGPIRGRVDPGGGELRGAVQHGAFLVKYDVETGAVKWQRAIGRSGNALISAIEVGAGGQVFAAGIAEGKVDHGGTTTHGGLTDVWVARHDPDGKLLAVERLAVRGSLIPPRLAVGAGDELTLGVEFVTSDLTIGEATFESRGFRDLAILRLGDRP